eukprot:4688480-Pyramimonas_sp.AAC.1
MCTAVGRVIFIVWLSLYGSAWTPDVFGSDADAWRVIANLVMWVDVLCCLLYRQKRNTAQHIHGRM